jgi:hypothetical protein
MAEKLIGQTQVVVKSQESDSLQPYHDDLYHPHQALWVLGEDSREGLHWKPQHCGVTRCPGRHSPLGMLVTSDDIQDAQKAVDAVPRNHFLHNTLLSIRPRQAKLQEPILNHIDAGIWLARPEDIVTLAQALEDHVPAQLQEKRLLEVAQHPDILEHVQHLGGQVGVGQVTLCQVSLQHRRWGLLSL